MGRKVCGRVQISFLVFLPRCSYKCPNPVMSTAVCVKTTCFDALKLYTILIWKLIRNTCNFLRSTPIETKYSLKRLLLHLPRPQRALLCSSLLSSCITVKLISREEWESFWNIASENQKSLWKAGQLVSWGFHQFTASYRFQMYVHIYFWRSSTGLLADRCPNLPMGQFPFKVETII